MVLSSKKTIKGLGSPPRRREFCILSKLAPEARVRPGREKNMSIVKADGQLSRIMNAMKEIEKVSADTTPKGEPHQHVVGLMLFYGDKAIEDVDDPQDIEIIGTGTIGLWNVGAVESHLKNNSLSRAMR